MTGLARKRISALLQAIDEFPAGTQERRLADEAVALAVEIGDEELEFLARLRLTASAVETGGNDTLLSSFAWCLAKHDTDPSRFPADLDISCGDLLWQYKWIPAALGASPIFSKSDIDAALNDMRGRYQRAGLGISGVLAAQFKDAWTNGRIAEAERLHGSLVAAAANDDRQCDVCLRSESIGFLVEAGREREALALADEMIEGGFSCGAEPETVLSRVLIMYLRAQRLDDAKGAHLRGYQLLQDKPDRIAIVARHLTFCAVTGNELRGLRMLERHIDWLARDGLNSAGHFAMLLACGVLLDAIAVIGHGDRLVRGADADQLVPFFGRHDGPWAVGDLAEAAWAAAARFAGAFDDRNGNGYFAHRLRCARDLAVERYDAPINTGRFAPTSADGAGPRRATGCLELAPELTPIEDRAHARSAKDGSSGSTRGLGVVTAG